MAAPIRGCDYEAAACDSELAALCDGLVYLVVHPSVYLAVAKMHTKTRIFQKN